MDLKGIVLSILVLVSSTVVLLAEEAEVPTITSRLYTLSGRTEPSAAVKLDINQKTSLNLKPDKAGRFSFKRVELQEGLNILTVVVTDVAGNITTTNRKIMVDTIPPAWEFVTPLPGMVTAEREVALVAKSEPRAVVVLAVNGNRCFACKVPADGKFEVGLSDLPYGTNRFDIVAKDRVGNRTEKSVEFLIRPSPLILNEPLDNLLSQSSTIRLSGSVAPGMRLNVSVDGLVVKRMDCSTADFSIPIRSLTEGHHLISISSQQGDKVWDTLERNIEIDTIPPKIKVVSPDPGAEVQTPTVDFVLTGEPLAKVVVRINGFIKAEGSLDAKGIARFPAVVCESGINAVTVTATDKTGNQTVILNGFLKGAMERLS